MAFGVFSWRARVAIVVGVILFFYGLYQYRESYWETERLRTVAENTNKAQQLKAQIDQRFPVGTTELAILDFLLKEHPAHVSWPSTPRTEYGVAVGQEPSGVWYCGSWTAYVTLACESGRLVETGIKRWSTDCL